MNYYATTSRGIALKDVVQSGDVVIATLTGETNQIACYTINNSSLTAYNTRLLFSSWDTVLKSLDGTNWTSGETKQVVFSQTEGGSTNAGTSAECELIFKKWKNVTAEPRIIQFRLTGATTSNFKTNVLAWFSNNIGANAFGDYVLTCANILF